MRQAILFCVLLPTPAHGAYSSYVGAEYVRNYDGDTVTFNLPWWPEIVGSAMNIRVAGVDTPEIRGGCQWEKELAVKAKNFVESELRGAKLIILTDMSRGKYFRIVTRVIYDGKDLSGELIKAKLAVPYFGGRKTREWCRGY